MSRTTAAASSQFGEFVFQELRSQITYGRYRKGDRLGTFRAMAREFDTTVGVVRTAMNRLEELGLVVKKAGSGVYVNVDSVGMERPRQAVQPSIRATRNHRTVVMFLDHSGEFWGDIARELTDRMVKQDLTPMPMSCIGNGMDQYMLPDQRLIDEWTEDPPYAFILQQFNYSPLLDQIEEVCKGRTHLIRVHRSRPGWHSIRIDHKAWAEDLVERLVSRGHRRIGFTTNRRILRPDQVENNRKSSAEHTPYILALGKALRARGIRNGLKVMYTDRLTPDDASYRSASPLSPHNVQHAVKFLGQPNRPTAVVGQDTRIVGVLMAAKQMGLKIGRDLEVVGLGDTTWTLPFDFPSYDFRPLEYVGCLESILRQPPPPFGPVQDSRVVAEYRPAPSMRHTDRAASSESTS